MRLEERSGWFSEAPSEEELFRFMADVDEDGTGEIEFAEFLRAFEKQRGGAQVLVLDLF